MARGRGYFYPDISLPTVTLAAKMPEVMLAGNKDISVGVNMDT